MQTNAGVDNPQEVMMDMFMVIDSYTPDLLDLEAIEEASQDYLRIPAAGDIAGNWSRSFPVQYPTQRP